MIKVKASLRSPVVIAIQHGGTQADAHEAAREMAALLPAFKVSVGHDAVAAPGVVTPWLVWCSGPMHASTRIPPGAWAIIDAPRGRLSVVLTATFDAEYKLIRRAAPTTTGPFARMLELAATLPRGAGDFAPTAHLNERMQGTFHAYLVGVSPRYPSGTLDGIGATPIAAVQQLVAAVEKYGIWWRQMQATP